MDRRSFLSTAIAAPAIPLVTPRLIRRQPASDLDLMVQLANANVGLPFEFDGWKIIFTGWKEFQGQAAKAHQWVAAPINPFGIFERNSLLRFFSAMPGYFGLMSRGDFFDISCRWNQLVYLDDFPGEHNWDRAVRVSGWLLLEGIKGAFDFSACQQCESPVPGHSHATAKLSSEDYTPCAQCYLKYTNQWDFSKLPPPLHFYADPDGFFMSQGMTTDEAFNSGFAEHCRKTLYGLA